jgi:hypothetical protein
MANGVAVVPLSRLSIWIGRVLSALVALFMLMDAVMKLVKPAFVVEKTTELGYAESAILPMGVALLVSTVLYIVPQTAVLGAIMLTGYLGGAVATHVFHQDSAMEVIMPAIFGAVVWAGIALRDARLRAVLPWRR